MTGTRSIARRLRQLTVGLTVLIALFAAFAYFAGPPLAKSFLIKRLGEELGRPVSVGEIDINPFKLTVRVTDFKVADTGGAELLAFDELFLDAGVASLRYRAPVLDEVRLTGPRFNLVRERDDRYNISDLLDKWLKPSDSPPALFSVNNIALTGGKLTFDDRPLGRRHAATEIRLSLPFVSNLPHRTEVFTEPAFAAVINGAPLELTGKTKPFAEYQESELVLALDNVELPPYLAYSPRALPFQLRQGRLDLDLHLLFRRKAGEPGVATLDGKLLLRDLQVVDSAGKPLLSLAQLDLPIVSLQPLAGQFKFGAIALTGLEAHAGVDRNGQLNWLALAEGLAGDSAGGTPVAKPAREPARAADWSVAGVSLSQATLHWLDESNPKPLAARLHGLEFSVGALSAGLAEPIEFSAAAGLDAGAAFGLGQVAIQGQAEPARQKLHLSSLMLKDLKAALARKADGGLEWLAPPKLKMPAAKESPGEPASPWTVELAKATLTGAALRFDDRAVPTEPVHHLDISQLSIENFSTAPRTAAKLELAARINKRGSLQAKGTVQAAPLATRLNLDIRDIELLKLQPYFTDRLNITVTSGQINAKGELALDLAQDSAPAGGYRGQVTVNGFHSIDNLAGQDFLSWKVLHLGGIDVALAPFSLAIGEVAMSDYFARLIVSPEGELNLLKIVKAGESATPPPAPAPPAAGPKVPPPVRIDQVSLQAGRVSFTDNFIRPNYSAILADVGGKISGLSSVAGSTADLDLRGAYDSAPVMVAGKINPLAAEPTLDLKAEVVGIELTPMTPYSGKYVGYAIEKGKLSLFLGYRIADGKLQAENRVFLDQLTFGDKVESASATSLPVMLAVALLKNGRGEIDINLPISGSLNDPEFSVGGIILQVIVNLITKAVTAPFALLGSLFGGGEELSQVEFAAGQVALTAETLKRLETLAKALSDRPGLRLEATGFADPESDREGMKRVLLDYRVRAQKIIQLVKGGKEVGAADQLLIDEKEYPGLLEQAYKLETFPKPRNAVGLTKSLPREEMEKLILANTSVSDDELRELANRRARAVVDWLSGVGKVPRERIFLVAPKLVAGDAKAPPARVSFSLK